MLAVLGVWRYVVRQWPVRYDPLYWAAVFPLGMYAAATHEMSAAIGLEFLRPVPTLFLYVVLAAWTVAFAGFVRDLMRAVTNPEPTNQ